MKDRSRHDWISAEAASPDAGDLIVIAATSLQCHAASKMGVRLNAWSKVTFPSWTYFVFLREERFLNHDGYETLHWYLQTNGFVFKARTRACDWMRVT